MQQLIILRGIPASGKSTFAKLWVDEDPENRIRINRDDLRLAFFNTKTNLTHTQEAFITRVEAQTAEHALKAGYSVIVDAMNLRNKFVRNWIELGNKHGINATIMAIYSTLEASIIKNNLRPDPVPEEFIKEVYDKFTSDGVIPDVTIPEKSPEPSIKPYSPPPGTPEAIMVDIDGTIAIHHNRSPYDESKVMDDHVNTNIQTLVQALSESNFEIIYCSGRTEACRGDTHAWLRKHNFPSGTLAMREVGDTRKDSIVKQELFDTRIRNNYNIIAVFDDRNQVVDMWRELGLTCLQVAPGDF